MSAPLDDREITPRIRRIALTAAVVAIGASVVGSAFSPYLLTHQPALLLALAPEPRHVVLTAGVLPGWVIVPLVVLRRLLGLGALYALGWVYGQAAVDFVERRSARLSRLLRWVEAKLARWGAALLLVLPMPTVVIMAGVAGTPARASLVALLLGQCFWTTVTWLFGDAALGLTTPIVEFVARHVVPATIVCALLIFGTQARSWLRRRRDARAAEPLSRETVAAEAVPLEAADREPDPRGTE